MTEPTEAEQRAVGASLELAEQLANLRKRASWLFAGHAAAAVVNAAAGVAVISFSGAMPIAWSLAHFAVGLWFGFAAQRMYEYSRVHHLAIDRALCIGKSIVEAHLFKTGQQGLTQ